MLETGNMIDRIVSEVLAQGRAAARDTAGTNAGSDPALVPVGVSNRHIHLSRQDMDALFGPGVMLTRKKAMKQPGQYAAEETVILRGPKGEIGKVRVLGPLRKDTQVEVSTADGFALGVRPPLRMSGKLEDTPGLEIVGPHGSVRKSSGVIVAMRHIHMLPETAALLGLANGDEVSVLVGGPRGGIMHHVAIRAAEASATEMHIDVEEANAFGLKNDDLVRILRD
ncbi:phosphate propanoyltransferase [Rhodovulum sulfidophilum]|uniref:phosphate propanoyltransferase n=2 Tax=Rhodovulum sulfidophilum TaxID=35806 RepID=UPI0009512691|nr:phosphate propanoyltransferase [Rhodovulum sulfidophilum]MCE8420259.1 phosphate propanoyltransferase [Rhodovulum sulfidophilum]MCE8439780.1 phosphate propanoyltransferase [Rhodovulum sulfidophilum]MCE8456134.1 phosphate propanoyltransferase [Rhodovulum sulfidophilum]MCE8470118.1 phosphate propanoyltransferase [Rhodovulum sulfidophilum]NDK33978.1 phosphate propanoyltransferase [Rhodovulum sulfidophilum]